MTNNELPSYFHHKNVLLSENGRDILSKSSDLLVFLKGASFTFLAAEMSDLLLALNAVDNFITQQPLGTPSTVDAVNNTVPVSKAKLEALSTGELIQNAYQNNYLFPVRIIYIGNNISIEQRIEDEFKIIKEQQVRPATFISNGINISLVTYGSGLIFLPISPQAITLPSYALAWFARNAFSNDLKIFNDKGALTGDEMVEMLEHSSQQRAYRSPVRIKAKLQHLARKQMGKFTSLSLPWRL